jgi:hypothetical protein
MNACGGGYLPHRFSKENGYDNPSVYCDDLYETFEHIASVLESHIYIVKPGQERRKLGDELASAGEAIAGYDRIGVVGHFSGGLRATTAAQLPAENPGASRHRG